MSVETIINKKGFVTDILEEAIFYQLKNQDYKFDNELLLNTVLLVNNIKVEELMPTEVKYLTRLFNLKRQMLGFNITIKGIKERYDDIYPKMKKYGVKYHCDSAKIYFKNKDILSLLCMEPSSDVKRYISRIKKPSFKPFKEKVLNMEYTWAEFKTYYSLFNYFYGNRFDDELIELSELDVFKEPDNFSEIENLNFDYPHNRKIYYNSVGPYKYKKACSNWKA